MECDDLDLNDIAASRATIKKNGPYLVGGYADPFTEEDFSFVPSSKDMPPLEDEKLSSMTMSFSMAPLHTQRFLSPISVIPKKPGAGVPWLRRPPNLSHLRVRPIIRPDNQFSCLPSEW